MLTHSSGAYVPPRLAGRLTRARSERFVGRDTEQALWRGALCDDTPGFAVLWVHGPGGIGRSALLRGLADIAAEAGVSPLFLDLQELPARPEPFQALLRQALGLEQGRDLLPAVHAGPGVTLDGAEPTGATAAAAVRAGSEQPARRCEGRAPLPAS